MTSGHRSIAERRVSLVNKREHSETGSPGLRRVKYSPQADDLVRFSDEASDQIIADFVDNALHGPGPRATVRARLTEDENYLLLLFARRRAVEAMRRDSLPLALEAVAALTLVEEPKIDFRDLSVDFPLFAVRELGGDLDAVISEAVDLSEPGTARSFAAKRERARSLSLRDCALVRVSTSHGIGFMEDWEGAVSPPVALAELAVQLADSIEDEGTYTDARMHVSALPSVWFGGQDELVERISGCVSIGVRHIATEEPFSHGLLVFLADVADEKTVVELSRRLQDHSTVERPQVAAAHGRLLVTIIGGSTTFGESSLESAESLRRFCSVAEPLLRSSSSR
jgi:hypothetical protein